MKKRAKGSVYQRGETWWLSYYVDGQRIQESARTKNRRAAEKLLTQRRTQIREGTWVDPRKGGARPSSPTLAAYLEEWIADRERAGVTNIRDERRWLREHVIPVLGKRRVGAVTRVDVKRLVQGVSTKVSARTKRPYSPRTVLHIYRTLATAYKDAVRDGVVAGSPCTLLTRRGELPAKADASTRWRIEAVYSQDEAETLLGAEAVPLERRVLYGLMLMAGLRGSEATGRRWRDYDPQAQPLGRLIVATQADGTDGEKPTKTGDVREVPVVPGLAALLAEWRLLYPVRFGIHPSPADPIVPGPRCKPHDLRFRGATTAYMGLKRDLDVLGLRRVPALRHSMRATFLTLLESDGANMQIAKRATHRPPSDVVSGYIRTSWADLCREVGRLRLTPRKPAQVVRLPFAVGDNRGDTGGTEEESPRKNQGLQAPDAGLEPPTLGAQSGKNRVGRTAPLSTASAETGEFRDSGEGRKRTGTLSPKSSHVATLRRMLVSERRPAERAALSAAIEALATSAEDEEAVS